MAQHPNGVTGHDLLVSDDGYQALTMLGVTHEIEVMDADAPHSGARYCVLLKVTSPSGEGQGLLDQDDVNALAQFLDRHRDDVTQVG